MIYRVVIKSSHNHPTPFSDPGTRYTWRNVQEDRCKVSSDQKDQFLHKIFWFLYGKFSSISRNLLGTFSTIYLFFDTLTTGWVFFLISLYFSSQFHRKWVIKLNSYIGNKVGVGKSEKTEFNINQLLEIIVFLFNCKIKCILSAYLFSVFYLWQSLDNKTQAST